MGGKLDKSKGLLRAALAVGGREPDKFISLSNRHRQSYARLIAVVRMSRKLVWKNVECDECRWVLPLADRLEIHTILASDMEYRFWGWHAKITVFREHVAHYPHQSEDLNTKTNF